jgi:hypothetical protein
LRGILVAAVVVACAIAVLFWGDAKKVGRSQPLWASVGAATFVGVSVLVSTVLSLAGTMVSSNALGDLHQYAQDIGLPNPLLVAGVVVGAFVVARLRKELLSIEPSRPDI